jgi:hypothetical protein
MDDYQMPEGWCLLKYTGWLENFLPIPFAPPVIGSDTSSEGPVLRNCEGGQ